MRRCDAQPENEGHCDNSCFRVGVAGRALPYPECQGCLGLGKDKVNTIKFASVVAGSIVIGNIHRQALPGPLPLLPAGDGGGGGRAGEFRSGGVGQCLPERFNRGGPFKISSGDPEAAALPVVGGKVTRLLAYGCRWVLDLVGGKDANIDY